MKNSIKLILCALTIGLTQSLIAQDTETNKEYKVKFGVKGGINFSNMNTNNVNDESVLTGFNLGVFAKHSINKHIAIQPELYFTTKGAKLTYNNALAIGTGKFNLNYIEAPLLVVVNLTDRFNIHGGGYVSYLINAKVSNESGPAGFNFENSLNKDDFNRFEGGLAVGFGVDLNPVSFGVRYNHGLTTVGKERNFTGTNYTFADGKNSVVNLYASFSFN